MGKWFHTRVTGGADKALIAERRSLIGAGYASSELIDLTRPAVYSGTQELPHSSARILMPMANKVAT